MGDLTTELRDAAGALAALVPHAVSFGPAIVESIEKATAAVEPELAKSEIVLSVVGEPSAKRALLRAILGADAIEGPKAHHERTIRIRARGPYDYVAHRKDGSVMRFARSVPDRDPLYRKSIEQAEEKVRVATVAREALVAQVDRTREEVRTIEASIATMDSEAEIMGEAFADAWRAQKAAEARVVAIDKAEPDVPPIFRESPAWWALWIWIMRLMMQSKWREPLALRAQNRAEARAARERERELETAAKTAETARDELKRRRQAETERLERVHASLAAAEVALAEEHAVEDAEAHVDELLRDQAKYAGERKGEFYADLHDFDASARGDDIGDIDVELPLDEPNAPPQGIVLVIGPSVAPDADGYVVVREMSDKAGAYPSDLPRVATIALRGKVDVSGALAKAAADKTRVVAAKLALRVRTCISDVASARARAEAEHQKRLASLESQRIPHPDEFRAKQLARAESAIDDSANDVLTAALEHTQSSLAVVRKEWTERLSSAKKQREIEAAIADINQRGKLRVLELLESTSELVAREMQSHGETIERFALDEIQSSYRTQKRMRAESLAPVASELTGEELAEAIAPLVPIVGARESFRKKRLQITAGGVLAGVAAGSAIHLGVGTAVGFAAGALSFFLRPTASLRKDSLERSAQYIDRVSTHVEQLLREKRGDIAEGIRASLDEALAEALRRINDAITRLMAVEKNAIEAERATLARLASTRGTLEDHDARLRARLQSFADS
jgi:hypothetical protein